MTPQTQALRLAREALKNSQNALLDYIPTIEKRGASLHYGRKVLEYIKEALTAIDKALEGGG